MTAAVELENVCKSYPVPGSPGQNDTVLDGVTLNLAGGARAAITGPSGSGKSTLLNIIGTLDTPTSGEVRLMGESVVGLRDAQVASLRNHKLGFIFQLHHLLPQCTLLENVLVPILAVASADERREAVRRAEELLEQVGLGNVKTHRPGELSGGQRQRAAVVRALVNRPSLVLADEPTGALDAASARALGDLLVELNEEEKVSLIVATHDRELAARIGGISRLEEGKLVEGV